MKKEYRALLIAGMLAILGFCLTFFACDNQFLSDGQKIISNKPEQLPAPGLPPFSWSTNLIYVIEDTGNNLLFEPPSIAGALNPSGLSVGFAAEAIGSGTITHTYFDFSKPENPMIDGLSINQITTQNVVMEIIKGSSLAADAQSYVLKVLPPALFGKDKDKFDLNAAALNLTVKPVRNTVWAQRRLESHEFGKIELAWGADGDTSYSTEAQWPDYIESLLEAVITRTTGSGGGVISMAGSVYWYGTAGDIINEYGYLGGSINDTTVTWYNGAKPDLSSGYLDTQTLVFNVGEFLSAGDTESPLNAIITVPVTIYSSVGGALEVLKSNILSVKWSTAGGNEDAVKTYIGTAITTGPFAKVGLAGVGSDVSNFTFTGLPSTSPAADELIPVKVSFNIPGGSNTPPEIPYNNYEFTVTLGE